MIKDKRKKMKITQETIARMLDITLRHYQNIESYKSIPSVLIGYKISIILDSDISVLWFDFL